MSNDESANYLKQAAIDAGIRDPRELANFMAQTQVESQDFQRLEENLHYSGSGLLKNFHGHNGLHTLEQANAIAAGGPEAVAEAVYGGEWGKSIGNIYPGDGWKYRGRGYIQLTGYDQYAAASKAIGLDLVNHPDWVARYPKVAAQTAIYYWQHVVERRGHQSI